MTNRDLLKEAIADAKAVKEVAITNAKAALEEAFTPHLKSMLEKKLTDMNEDDYVTDKSEHDDEPFGHKKAAKVTDYEEVEEDIDLEELLRELEGEDVEEAEEDSDVPADDLEGAEEESEDEELDFDNMTAEDLESFIEKVVDEMIAAGELEGGHEGMENEPEEEMELDVEEPADEEPMQEPGEIMAEKADDKKEERDTEKMKSLEEDLAEAFNVINTLKSELNEVNLLNSKLLYTNKIFKAKNLSEAQKVQVLTAFDKAESVKETKLVYETLSSNLNKSDKRELVKENRSFASKTISGTSNKQPVMETSAMVERFQKLAGLK